MLHYLKYVLSHFRLGIWIVCQIGGNSFFYGHFVKGQDHGHFHGQFSGHNSYNIILIQYKCYGGALPDLVSILVDVQLNNTFK